MVRGFRGFVSLLVVSVSWFPAFLVFCSGFPALQIRKNQSGKFGAGDFFSGKREISELFCQEFRVFFEAFPARKIYGWREFLRGVFRDRDRFDLVPAPHPISLAVLGSEKTPTARRPWLADFGMVVAFCCVVCTVKCAILGAKRAAILGR